ncbi:hypothetical protein [Massilia sp. DD77]|uniref:hypothetical protein n=1 Tax=Massilia sp. DD77 TaxID=3109349 RepID=UPI002FFDE9BD
MHALYGVLWQPKRVFTGLADIKVSRLVVAFILIEFLYSLSIYSHFSEGAAKAIAASPHLTAGSAPYLVAITIFLSSMGYTLMVALLAVLFLIVAYILGGKPSYRAVFGMLLLASAPALLDHLSRGAAYLGGWNDGVGSLLALHRLLPVPESGLLAEALKTFDMFDIWISVLVTVGFVCVSGLKRYSALGGVLLVWGAFLLLAFRIHMLGVAA